MSRTFRRKNFEATRRNAWRDIYLVYESCVLTGNGHGGYWPQREPTKAEFNAKYHWLHGESKSNLAWSPNREYYRRPMEVQLRFHNERELYRYFKDPDNYEEMCESKPMSCFRNWVYY